MLSHFLKKWVLFKQIKTKKKSSTFKSKWLCFFFCILWQLLENHFSCEHIDSWRLFLWTNLFSLLLLGQFLSWEGHLVSDLLLVVWMKNINFFTKRKHIFGFWILRETSYFVLIIREEGTNSLLAIKLISSNNGSERNIWTCSMS